MAPLCITPNQRSGNPTGDGEHILHDVADLAIVCLQRSARGADGRQLSVCVDILASQLTMEDWTGFFLTVSVSSF